MLVLIKIDDDIDCRGCQFCMIQTNKRSKRTLFIMEKKIKNKKMRAFKKEKEKKVVFFILNTVFFFFSFSFLTRYLYGSCCRTLAVIPVSVLHWPR